MSKSLKPITTIDLGIVGTVTQFGLYRRCHDIAQDPKGNLYITDIGGGMIWKVDSTGHASVWSTDPLYKLLNTSTTPFSLSGVAYHPDGFLFVAHYSSSYLFKIVINADGSAGHPIIIADHTILNQPNAIEIIRKDKVIINDFAGVYTLTTKDAWAVSKADNVDVSPKWHPPFYSPMCLFVPGNKAVYALLSDLPKYFTGGTSSDFYIYTLTTEIPGLYDGISGGGSKAWIIAVVILLIVAAICIGAAIYWHLQTKKAQKVEMP